MPVRGRTDYMSQLKEAESHVAKLRTRAQARREYHRTRVMWLRTTVTGELTKMRWKVEDIRRHVEHPRQRRGREFMGMLDTLDHCLAMALEMEAQYDPGETSASIRERRVSRSQAARQGQVEPGGSRRVECGPSAGLVGNAGGKEPFK